MCAQRDVERWGLVLRRFDFYYFFILLGKVIKALLITPVPSSCLVDDMAKTFRAGATEDPELLVASGKLHFCVLIAQDLGEVYGFAFISSHLPFLGVWLILCVLQLCLEVLKILLVVV